MRRAKAGVLAGVVARYRDLRRAWGGYSGYDRWFAQPLTNAHVASVATYTELVPGFERLLAESGGNLPRFYAAVKRLASADAAERARVLAWKFHQAGPENALRPDAHRVCSK